MAEPKLTLENMAISCVVVSGIIEAAQQAAGGPTNPFSWLSVPKAGMLNYLPIALLSLAGIFWLIKALSGKASVNAQLNDNPLERFKNVLRWKNPRLKQIAIKEFHNQEVVLDGTSYIDCVFDGVTLIYHGTAPTNITSSKIKLGQDGKPSCRFQTDNPIIGSVALIFQGIGLLREDAKRRIESPPLDQQ